MNIDLQPDAPLTRNINDNGFMPNRLLFFATAFAFAASAQVTPIEIAKPTLDIGIIVSDMDKADAFYGKVLGLERSTMAMPDGSTMVRYRSGTSTIKLRALPKAAKYDEGLRKAVGIRVLSLFTYDVDGVVKRYVDSGAAKNQPRVAPYGNQGIKLAFLADPDGDEIEMIGLPATRATDTPIDRMQIGLTVSDPEKSREFYGKILGLPEQKAQAQALLDGNLEYMFNAGRTTIKFWIADGEDVPKHTGAIGDAIGLRYFTFIVKDLDATYALLKTRGAKIVREPMDFGTIARIMMVADPDGNYVEFAAPRTSPK